MEWRVDDSLRHLVKMLLRTARQDVEIIAKGDSTTLHSLYGVGTERTALAKSSGIGKQHY